MPSKIHKETVTDLLWSSLITLMNIESLKSFRLVGGTALSLLIGHRMSIDIDLFSDVEYRSIDFKNVYKKLKKEFKFISKENWNNNTIGNSCFIGNSQKDTIKLDLFYTDDFVYPINIIEKVRISSIEEIIAMKLEIIGGDVGGRKKDYWDIHALIDRFNLDQMFETHSLRYPHSFTKKELKKGLTNFENADHDPDPICLRNKKWELIKLDFEELVNK